MKKSGIRDNLVYSKLTEIEGSLNIVSDNLPDKIEEFVTLGITKDRIYKRLEYEIENVSKIE